jgi:hypothetical protein
MTGEGRVRELTDPMFKIIRDHYLGGPTSRERVLEVLNALAICSAYVIAGAEDDKAQEFFNEALEKQIDLILREQEWEGHG